MDSFCGSAFSFSCPPGQADDLGGELFGYEIQSRELYEGRYCPRGDMESRIKEQPLDLFANRASSHFFRANQLRLWFSALAYVLMNALRATGLKNTGIAKAASAAIRTLLLKTGARVAVSLRRVVAHLSSAAPYQDVFIRAWCTQPAHLPDAHLA